ncbi:MAG: tetrahydrofolate dehydrogenase/cyclohydrolase catalytic domain-containing protein [Patescibacteria group bacterium]
MAILLNGKELAIQRSEALREEISLFPTQPTLVIIQIGNVPESDIYIKRKIQSGEQLGAKVIHQKYDSDISQEVVMDDIRNYNEDQNIHGIIVQLPLPENLNKNSIIETINPKKDVDGLTSVNVKNLTCNNLGIIPATTKGVITLLKHYSVELVGAHIVVVGRSSLVGKPTALALINENATVTICHSQTKNLEEITKTGDIIITATGKQNLITAQHVQEGQVIVDVGIHAIEDDGKKITGDVDFKNVEPIVEMLSPVPGGVGPMTVVSLFENLVDAYRK